MLIPPKMKILSVPVKIWKAEIDFFRSALFHMKTRVNLKYFVKGLY